MGHHGVARRNRPVPMSEPVYPDYGGACVTRVVAASMGTGDRSLLPEPARDASCIVLLVLDGLGFNELQRQRHAMPELAAMASTTITTVVPSTTASALPSITTGAAPGTHGIVGYRLREHGEILNVLHWTVAHGRPPEPATIQAVRPFHGRPVPAVTRSQFFGSGFTTAHLRGARMFGWYTTSTLVQRCRVLAAAGEPFVYAYYDGIDAVAHTRGLHDAFYNAEIAFADRLVGEFLDALPPRAALVITADHGQIELTPEGWVSMSDFEPLVEAHTGDARFRFLHARAGAAGELLDAARACCTDRAWVFSRDELLASGILGSARVSDIVAARIGDVVLAARDALAFADPAFPDEMRLKTGHGSMTADEMLVPLLAARGRALA